MMQLAEQLRYVVMLQLLELARAALAVQCRCTAEK